MLDLGSTYLITKDFEKSKRFYSSLLSMEVTNQNYNRWAQFEFCGKCIALWNPEYDNVRMSNDENIEQVYGEEYIKYQKNTTISYGNNVVLNFWTDDLQKEYNRLKKIKYWTYD